MVEQVSLASCEFDKSVDEFEKTLKLNEVFFKDTLKFDKYDRYMIIGVK